MADIGTLEFGVHLKDYTDAEADKIKKKLENLSVHLKIDGKNVTISQTDLIKKQIEDAIKSVSVQSVKIDTNAVRTQVNTALQGINPQVSVSIQKGALSNDLQNYLNTKVFTVGITITRGNAQSAINTAFANISVPVNVTVKASAAIQQLQQALSARNVKIGVEAKNPQDLINDIEKKLAGKKIKAEIVADPQIVAQSVRQALQGKLIKAQVDVSVDASAITRAVQSAINNASFTYSPNGRRSQSGGGRQSGGGSSNGWNPNAQRGLYESARASITLGSSLKTNIRLAGELGTSLGNLASIFGIKDLLANMVRIGGELENQKIALGAILQDGGKATEMFGKIQSLAVKSPFGIMDLNQYTKQLAAYGIEYNELYDTMKRMADISAGVGVDMGRIILAFGQVKAAGFLKGTELRQFTEANIPMVQALADRFSILEKRIVSAGDVYDMISEKKVSFEDVKAVLWELTGEGGRFNNMQEVLSESLASKWKNLADAVDVMYGKIANGTIGDWLKSLAEGLTEVTKQWEYVATAIKSAAAAYLVYRNQMNGKQIVLNTPINNLLASKQKQAEILKMDALYRNLTKAEQLLIKTTGELNIADMKRAIRAGELNRSTAIRLIQLKQLDDATSRYLVKLYAIQRQELEAAVKTNIFRSALTGLWTTIKGVGAALKTMIWNPFTATFAVIGGIAEIFTYYNKKSEEIKQRNEEIAESAKGSAESLERELLKLKDLDISKMNTDEIKIKIKELTTVIKNEAYGWQGILDDVFAQEADGTFTNSAAEQLRILKEKIDEIAEAKKALTDNNDAYSNVIGSTESGSILGLGGSNVIDAMKALNKAVDENDKKLRSLSVHLRDVVSAVNFASSDNVGLSELLKGKSPIEQVEILRNYENEWAKFKAKLSEINTEASQTVELWDSSINNITSYTVGGYLNSLLWKFGKAKEAMITELTLSGEDINNLSEKGAQIVKGFVETSIKESSTQKTKMKQFYYDLWTEAFDIDWVDLGYIVPPNATNKNNTEYYASKDEVAKMWKKRSEEIAKAVKMYDQWKKVEGTAKASERVKMNDELSDLFSGAYGFKLDLENPTAAYEYIQSKLNKGLSAQKELMIQLGVKISDAELKDAQDKLKSSVEQLKKNTKKIVEGWDLYEDLFKATGNKDVSMKIAFGGNVGFDSLLKHLESQIKGKMKELGIGISFDELIKMDTKSLEEAGFVGLTDLIETYNKENAKLKDESVKNFLEIIKNSKDFAQQIADVERQLQKELKVLEETYGADSEEYDRRSKESINRAEEKKSSINLEKFKKESNWVNVFSNLEDVPLDVIDDMIDKIEKLKAESTGMKFNELKELAEALKKLRAEMLDRNPFKLIGDAIETLSADPKSEEAWNNLFKGINRAIQLTKEMASSFSDAFKAMGVTVTEEGRKVLDGLESLGKGLAEVLVGYKTKDYTKVIGGLVQSASGMANITSGLFSNNAEKAEYRQYLLDIIRLQTEYNSALIDTKLLNEDVWGNTKIQDSINAVEALSQAVQYYNELVDKEVEAHVDPSGGFWKNFGKANYWNPLGWWSLGVDSLANSNQELVKIKDNLRYITQTPNMFRHTKTTNLVDWLKEEGWGDLFDKDGRLNLDLATSIKDWDRLTGETKEYLNNLIEAEEAIRKSEEALDDYLSDTFGDLGNQLSDAIVDAFRNGTDAAEGFKDSVVAVLEDVGAQMMRNVFLTEVFSEYEKDLKQIYGDYADHQDKKKFTEDLSSATKDFVDDTKDSIEAGTSWLEQYKKLMKEQGFDVFTPEKSESSLSKGIQSITENTGDLLASYVNSIRQSVHVKQQYIERLVSEDIPKINYLAEAQLRELSQIQANTARNVVLVGEIRDLVNRVVDKGSNKLKV